MADGKVTIDTELNNKGLNKGLKSSEKTLKDFAKSALKTGATAAAAAVSIKAITAGIKATTEAYKAQIKSEQTLEIASRNNPYLDSQSVQQLKEYADNIQKITGHDNILTQEYMTMLAGAGRTQKQIQDIILASADIASAGLMDMGTAVKELSKSYEGQGRILGQLIPEVRNLTNEEMKQGRAVDVIKKSYGGIAEETFKAIGATEDLKNAWGDLSKEIGATFEKMANAENSFTRKVTKLIENVTNSARQNREYFEAMEKYKKSIADASDLQKIVDDYKIRLNDIKEEMTDDALDMTLAHTLKITADEADKKQSEEIFKIIENNVKLYRGSISNAREVLELVTKEYEKQIILLEEQLDVTSKKEEEDNKAKQREKEKTDRIEKEKEKENARLAHIEAITKAREEQVEVLKINADLREEELDTAEELEIYMSSYVDLLIKSNGLVSAEDIEAKKLLKTIMNMAEAEGKRAKTKEEILEQEKALAEFRELIKSLNDDMSNADILKAQLADLENFKNKALELKSLELDEKLRLEEDFARAKKRLEKEIINEEIKGAGERVQSYLDVISSYRDIFLDAVNTMTSTATDSINARADSELLSAELLFKQGKIGNEEYQKRVTEINKSAAKERHQIALWEWGMNINQAMANMALGATKAIAEGGIAGIPLASVIIGAGLSQVAMIVANKPQPPAFAQGGIVGGTSYTGDKIHARVNSGEMILTRAQQARLFDIANTGSKNNIQIFNSASNDVVATPSITEDGIKIMIRKIVIDDMAKGRYNNSYKQMRGGLSGVRLTN